MGHSTVINRYKNMLLINNLHFITGVKLQWYKENENHPGCTVIGKESHLRQLCPVVIPSETLFSSRIGLNPEPVMVTVVPPYREPCFGETPVTRRMYSMVVFTPELCSR